MPPSPTWPSSHPQTAGSRPDRRQQPQPSLLGPRPLPQQAFAAASPLPMAPPWGWFPQMNTDQATSLEAAFNTFTPCLRHR
ncbi:hypothetical protein OSB04_012313 [Centaurea solstitialis]|uniref:Uncharacterized protein n=1 Tax=Centaurea solstitialis TaxID=347529 RepID=A0AA38TB50_9ASTR|nr:hypothetical protein OSB04_012313 [Centaurea solstitialis]